MEPSIYWVPLREAPVRTNRPLLLETAASRSLLDKPLAKGTLRHCVIGEEGERVGLATVVETEVVVSKVLDLETFILDGLP